MDDIESLKAVVCCATIEALWEGLNNDYTSGRITKLLREKGINVSRADVQKAGLLAIVNRDCDLNDRFAHLKNELRQVFDKY